MGTIEYSWWRLGDGDIIRLVFPQDHPGSCAEDGVESRGGALPGTVPAKEQQLLPVSEAPCSPSSLGA